MSEIRWLCKIGIHKYSKWETLNLISVNLITGKRSDVRGQETTCVCCGKTKLRSIG